MFFARRVVLVEGEEDIVAYLAAGRKAEIYREFPEEIGYTIIASESKNEMVKFMKLLNAFHIPYVIVHELDGEPDDELNKSIEELLGNNRRVCIETRLEDVAGHEGHFKKIYTAKKYFENSENITKELVEKTIEIFSDPEIVAIDD
jgi:putative ATP-dependent endonuclease of OLD family